MKKNALAVLLPVAAGVALSGTGFGVWVFNKDIKAQNAYVGLQVEPAITLESMDQAIVTVTNANDPAEKKKVIFDQDYIGVSGAWTIKIDCTINYSTINGIIGTTTDGSTSWKTGTELDKEAIKDALDKVTVTATPDFKGGVATYVKSVDAIEKKLSDIDVTEFSLDEDGTGNVTVNFEFELSPSAEYDSIKTLDKYTKMKEAMSTADTYLGFNIKLVNGYVA